MPSADWCSSKTLLVLLRGTAFRGNHHNAAEEQRESLQSIHTHLLQPAISLGWKPAVLADVVVPDGGGSMAWNSISRATLGDYLLADRAALTHPANMQSTSILASIHWAETADSAAWKSHAALLLLRVDLLLKIAPPLPPPGAATCEDRCVTLPFALDETEYHTKPQRDTKPVLDRGGCSVAVADTLIWLPRRMHGAFVMALNGSAHGTSNLHSLHELLPVTLFYPLTSVNADANTDDEANPLYHIIGRKQGSHVRTPMPANSSCADWPLDDGFGRWETGRIRTRCECISGGRSTSKCG